MTYGVVEVLVVVVVVVAAVVAVAAVVVVGVVVGELDVVEPVEVVVASVGGDVSDGFCTPQPVAWSPSAPVVEFRSGRVGCSGGRVATDRACLEGFVSVLSR